MHEHAEKSDQPMFLHLEKCEAIQESFGLFNLPDIDKFCESIQPQNHYLSAILNNYKIISTNHNKTLLALSEAYYIRKLKPEINDGLKSCLDFKVFDF